MIRAMDALRLPDGPLEVLCVGAHPDDVEIGCGGTLQRLAERTDLQLTVAVLTGTPDRAAESMCALQEILPSVKTHFAALPDGRLPSHTSAPSGASAGDVFTPQAALPRPTGEQLHDPGFDNRARPSVDRSDLRSVDVDHDLAHVVPDPPR